jgi:hypothetical protein
VACVPGMHSSADFAPVSVRDSGWRCLDRGAWTRKQGTSAPQKAARKMLRSRQGRGLPMRARRGLWVRGSRVRIGKEKGGERSFPRPVNLRVRPWDSNHGSGAAGSYEGAIAEGAAGAGSRQPNDWVLRYQRLVSAGAFSISVRRTLRPPRDEREACFERPYPGGTRRRTRVPEHPRLPPIASASQSAQPTDRRRVWQCPAFLRRD